MSIVLIDLPFWDMKNPFKNCVPCTSTSQTPSRLEILLSKGLFLKCHYAVWDLPALSCQTIPSARIAAVEYVQDPSLVLSNDLSSCQASQHFFLYWTSCRFSNRYSISWLCASVVYPNHFPCKEFCHLKLFLVNPTAIRFIVSFPCFVILFLIS